MSERAQMSDDEFAALCVVVACVVCYSLGLLTAFLWLGGD